MSHTPGPWKAILHGNETYPFPLSIHTADDANWIARDGTTSSIANACLIAATPDLLEALKNWRAMFKFYHPDDPVMNKLREVTDEVLAKAKP